MRDRDGPPQGRRSGKTGAKFNSLYAYHIPGTKTAKGGHFIEGKIKVLVCLHETHIL